MPAGKLSPRKPKETTHGSTSMEISESADTASSLAAKIAAARDIQEVFSCINAEPDDFEVSSAQLLAAGAISVSQLTQLIRMRVDALVRTEMESRDAPPAQAQPPQQLQLQQQQLQPQQQQSTSSLAASTDVPDIAIIGCVDSVSGDRALHMKNVGEEIEGIASLFPSSHMLLKNVSAAAAASTCGPMPLLHFAGHANSKLPGDDQRPVLVWTTAIGSLPEAVDASTLESILGGKACVVLNGCKSAMLAESLVAKGLAESVICWETLVGTKPARLFATAFWRAFAAARAEDERSVAGMRAAVRDAFEQGANEVLCFTKKGSNSKLSTPLYALVDPEDRMLVGADFRVRASADTARAGRIAAGVPLLLQPLPNALLYMVPELPSTFVERPAVAAALRQALLADAPAQLGKTCHVAITGRAGLGKSVIATWLARDVRVQTAFRDGICYLRFGPELAALSNQRELAEWLGLPHSACAGLTDAMGDAKRVLTPLLKGKRVLIVCDEVCDAEQAAAFENLASPGGRLAILTTTRSTALAGGTQGHDVRALPPMDASESCALLAKHLKRPLEAVADDESALSLQSSCGGLPIWLCGAASMVACNGLPEVARQLSEPTGGRKHALDDSRYDGIGGGGKGGGGGGGSSSGLPLPPLQQQPPPSAEEVAAAPIGTRERPISRAEFVRVMLPHLSTLLDNESERWCKVAPTLVLFPDDDAAAPPANAAALPAPGAVRTLLKTRAGQTFEEALIKCHGKALLLNFCTPSLEVYPKGADHMSLIYDLERVGSAVVPEETEDALLEYLMDAVRRANPLVPNTQMVISEVARAMQYYKRALGRRGPWRIAFNKAETGAIARKLTRHDLGTMLSMLQREVPYLGERLFREESYSPTYEFGVGDWVCLDVDPETGGWRLDRDGHVLVRTVSETSFESTYQCVGPRS